MSPPDPATTSSGARAVIHEAGEGRHFWGMRACITVKLPVTAVEDGRAGAAEFLMPARFGPPLHIHHEEDEILQILEGRVRIVCGDQDVVAGPGAFAFLPRGVPHTFWVRDGPARMLAIFTPGGVEAMFVDSGQPADAQRLPGDGTVQPGAMTPHEKRHHVEMVGPPLGG